MKRLVLVWMGTVLATAGIAGADYTLATEVVADGFTRPVFATTPPGDTTRLFVLEQHTGLVRIVEGGAILEPPFLDLGGDLAQENEQGLLGMAFDPAFAETGRVYLSYTRGDGASVVARYTVPEATPNLADPNTAEIVFGPIPQPFANHNGGMIAFGPDGYLYLSLGDGGSRNDPDNRAQDLDTVLGKLLRLDVSGDGPAVAPPTNPFVSLGGDSPYIWAYGLRNPWRFTFDRATGDMYIGDVGQNAFEEIDYQPASSMGGENYGWKLLEASNPHLCPYPTEQECDERRAETVLPIHEYPRDVGRSVTGGYVYRGPEAPGFHGTYLFADFVTSRVWSFRYGPGGVEAFTERTGEVQPPGGEPIAFIPSFGEGPDGTLYLLDFANFVEGAGRVLRIRVFSKADFDRNGEVDATDIQQIINVVLGADDIGPAADVNGDGEVDAADIQRVINEVLGVV